MVNKLKSIKTIAINSTYDDERVLEIAKQCNEVLISQGVKVLFTKNLSKLQETQPIKCASENKILKEADLLISIGGDGTMLSSARKYGSKGLPILGINLGNLGFLTDIAPEDITTGLTEVLSGNYIKDERIFLQASSSKKGDQYLALNEIVIHSGALAQLIEYELYVNDSYVYTQRADGIIVSTPTGSTAYSLSGGGPIVHPSVRAITILPMFPHSLSSSSLLVDETSSIAIKITKCKGKASLTFDSHDSININKGDSVIVSMNKTKLTLIHPIGHDFFSGCRNKLGWSTSITKV